MRPLLFCALSLGWWVCACSPPASSLEVPVEQHSSAAPPPSTPRQGSAEAPSAQPRAVSPSAPTTSASAAAPPPVAPEPLPPRGPSKVLPSRDQVRFLARGVRYDVTVQALEYPDGMGVRVSAQLSSADGKEHGYSGRFHGLSFSGKIRPPSPSADAGERGFGEGAGPSPRRRLGPNSPLEIVRDYPGGPGWSAIQPGERLTLTGTFAHECSAHEAADNLRIVLEVSESGKISLEVYRDEEVH